MDKKCYQVISRGNQLDQEITAVFCCDLLSVAMSKAPAGCAWITVMANVNTLAVASLTQVACIILAEGVNIPEDMKEAAMEHNITLFLTDAAIFPTAKKLDEWIFPTLE